MGVTSGSTSSSNDARRAGRPFSAADAGGWVIRRRTRSGSRPIHLSLLVSRDILQCMSSGSRDLKQVQRWANRTEVPLLFLAVAFLPFRGLSGQ